MGADAYFCIDPEFVFAIKRLHPACPVICRVEGTPAGDRASWRTPSIKRWSSRLSRRSLYSTVLEYQNNRLNRSAWHRADSLICKSELIRGELIDEYGIAPGKISIIPNGVDFHHFSSAIPAPDVVQRACNHSDRLVVTFVGRLSRVKNLELALHALARLPKRASIEFVVVGDGEERRNLEDLAITLEISHLVRFVGHKDDVAPYLRASDVFVLPSLYETIANCLLEAMSAGCACIALRPDGKRIRTASEVVIRDGDTGLLVDGTDAEILANALNRLHEDKTLRRRLAMRGQELVRRNFNWASCASQYLRIAEQFAGLDRTSLSHPKAESSTV